MQKKGLFCYFLHLAQFPLSDKINFFCFAPLPLFLLFIVCNRWYTGSVSIGAAC